MPASASGLVLASGHSSGTIVNNARIYQAYAASGAAAAGRLAMLISARGDYTSWAGASPAANWWPFDAVLHPALPTFDGDEVPGYPSTALVKELKRAWGANNHGFGTLSEASELGQLVPPGIAIGDALHTELWNGTSFVGSIVEEDAYLVLLDVALDPAPLLTAAGLAIRDGSSSLNAYSTSSVISQAARSRSYESEWLFALVAWLDGTKTLTPTTAGWIELYKGSSTFGLALYARYFGDQSITPAVFTGTFSGSTQYSLSYQGFPTTAFVAPSTLHVKVP